MDHNKLWKILKEMGIPDNLTCLLRNLYAGQEATVGYWKRPSCWKDEGQEEKGATEDEMLEGISDSVDMSLHKL